MSPHLFAGLLALQGIGYPVAEQGDRQLAPALRLTGRASGAAGPGLRYAVAPRFVWDPGDDSRNRFLPTEAWVQTGTGPVELSAGLLGFEWGVSELFRPADPMNQRDYGAGMLRSEKLGDLGVATAFHGGGGGVELRLDAVWLPLRQRPRFPASNADVGATLQGFDGLRLSLGQGFTEDGDDGMTFAVRAAVRGELGEAEVFSMRGPSRLPAPWIDDLTLRAVDYSVDVHGGAISWVIEPVTLRAEGAWIDSGRATPFYVDENRPPWDDPIPDPYGAFVLGGQWTAWDVLGDQDLTVVAEYLGEVRDHRDAQAALRPWQNDLFVALRHAFDDLDDTRLELGAAVDLTYRDTLLVAAAERHLGAGFVGRLDAVWVIEGRSGPLSLLHELADRSSVAAELAWAF